MTGGESFDPARVTFTGENLNIDGNRSDSADSWQDAVDSGDAEDPGSTVSAGDSIFIGTGGDSFELDIIFTSEDGGTSSEIGGTSGPDA